MAEKHCIENGMTYYERLKADPEKLAEFKEKQKKRYRENYEKCREICRKSAHKRRLDPVKKATDNERQRAYQSRPDVKAKRKPKKDINNRKWVTENREYNRERLKAWRKKNAERVREYARNKRQTEENREWNRQRLAKRRASMFGVGHEPYVQREIFERDNWKCWICKTKVDRNKAYPHPMSPTIDHVIPLSKGGPDAAYNVACAHWGCNLGKSDKAISLW
jgi:hypothetical protein